MLSMMESQKLRVGVLMGGKSSEHEISLETGEQVLRALDSNTYRAVPIVITKENQWTESGTTRSPEELLRNVDLIFNAMHGEYGEDGRIQALLEFFGVPYTGSGVAASALSMDKPKSRALFRFFQLNTPTDLLFKESSHTPLQEKANVVLQSNPRGPWVVKPAHCGSSVGVSVVRDAMQLPDAMARAFAYDPEILIEEYLDGVEVTCGVLQDFSGSELYALPPVQIIPPQDHDFFDYNAKYSGATQEIVPAPLARTMLDALQHAACEAHRILGCRGYSRTDMIIVNGTPFVLELNTLPGLTPMSLFPKAAKAAGLGFPELIDHLVRLARNK